jgi:hypothetical protein
VEWTEVKADAANRCHVYLTPLAPKDETLQPVPTPAPTPTPTATPSPVAVSGSFAGRWNIYFHDNVEGTGEPTPNEMKITIGVDAEGKPIATGVVEEGFAWSCSGPLTENGRVWNAKRLVDGALSLQFADVRLSPDGNRFRGKWGGEAMHNYAWVGVRVGAADSADSAALKMVEINLGGPSAEYRYRVLPGARVIVRATLSSANPYVVSLGEFDRVAVSLVAERTEPIERKTGPSGKPLLGGPSERRIYEFKVGETATGTSRILVELRRPWETKASIRHTIYLTVVPSGKPGYDLKGASDR